MYTAKGIQKDSKRGWLDLVYKDIGNLCLTTETKWLHFICQNLPHKWTPPTVNVRPWMCIVRDHDNDISQCICRHWLELGQLVCPVAFAQHMCLEVIKRDTCCRKLTPLTSNSQQEIQSHGKSGSYDTPENIRDVRSHENSRCQGYIERINRIRIRMRRWTLTTSMGISYTDQIPEHHYFFMVVPL